MMQPIRDWLMNLKWELKSREYMQFLHGFQRVLLENTEVWHKSKM